MGELRLVWVDLEMTGLDPESCAIVDMGMIITGPDLVPIAEFARTIWQPDDVLATMSPFVRDMHTKNGLLGRIRESSHSLAEVERDAVAVLAKHTTFREGILAGNSIYQDRRFLHRYMPVFEGFLHYRQVDVSSLKVLTGAWSPPSAAFQKGDKNHTALDDIRGSIAELSHYRDLLFKR
jgi:oligoribonuclease